jgi:hypothetical protein
MSLSAFIMMSVADLPPRGFADDCRTWTSWSLMISFRMASGLLKVF